MHAFPAGKPFPIAGIALSTLYELGSALGFTLLSLAFDRATADQSENLQVNVKQPLLQSETPHALTKQVGIKHTNIPDDLVTRWALDRLDIVSSGTIQAEHAYKDFQDWCTKGHLQPLTRQMFGRRFTKVHADMGGRKVRRNGRAYYEGAALQDNSILTLKGTKAQTYLAA